MPDSDSTLSRPESVTLPEAAMPLVVARAIVALPAIANEETVRVPETGLVNVAPLPTSPAISRALLPMDPEVRLPPGPTDTEPVPAMLFVIAVRTSSVPPAFTVTAPVESALAFRARSVPDAIVSPPPNELATPRDITPGPAVVRAWVPDTGPSMISE